MRRGLLFIVYDSFSYNNPCHWINFNNGYLQRWDDIPKETYATINYIRCIMDNNVLFMLELVDN